MVRDDGLESSLRKRGAVISRSFGTFRRELRRPPATTDIYHGVTRSNTYIRLYHAGRVNFTLRV
jgi:hypothetical protein